MPSCQAPQSCHQIRVKISHLFQNIASVSNYCIFVKIWHPWSKCSFSFQRVSTETLNQYKISLLAWSLRLCSFVHLSFIIAICLKVSCFFPRISTEIHTHRVSLFIHLMSFSTSSVLYRSAMWWSSFATTEQFFIIDLFFWSVGNVGTVGSVWIVWHFEVRRRNQRSRWNCTLLD